MVRADGAVDEKLAELAAMSYSDDCDLNQFTKAALKELETAEIGAAFQTARDYLEKQTKLWDWDEEVDVIGIAKTVFLPARRTN